MYNRDIQGQLFGNIHYKSDDVLDLSLTFAPKSKGNV